MEAKDKDFSAHLRGIQWASGWSAVKEKRTLSEILIEADGASSVQHLKRLSTEIMDNKKKFPLCEIVFGLEHIRDLAYKRKAERTLKDILDE